MTVMNPRAGGGFAVYEEARSLLDWGFGAAGRVDPVGSLVPPGPVAQAGPDDPSPAVKEAAGSGWAETGTIAGAAGFGAGAVALALRLAAGRFARD